MPGTVAHPGSASSLTQRRPYVGYAMVLAAAALFGIDGTVAKVALSSGLSSLRLTEARSAGACLGLVVVALFRRPSSLRVARRELPRPALFGCVGVAFVQLTYFSPSTGWRSRLRPTSTWPLVLRIVVLGTIVPFSLVVGALRHGPHCAARRSCSPASVWHKPHDDFPRKGYRPGMILL